MIDFWFEVLTTHLNDGGRLPERSAVNGNHAYLGAPCGVYETADSDLAIAMTPSLRALAELIGVCGLDPDYDNAAALLSKRDEIKAILAAELAKKTTAEWLAILQPADIWCSEILHWPQLLTSEAWRLLDFQQEIQRNGPVKLTALRGRLHIDDCTLKSSRAAPALGADREKILSQQKEA